MEVVPCDRPRTLSGSEKVAAFLLALDRDLAQQVLRHFDQEELRKIAKCAAGLGSIPAEYVDLLIAEFTNQFSKDAPDLIGTAGEAEQLIHGVVPPEQLADIMSHVVGGSNKYFWDRLARIEEARLSAYLRNENPQLIAAVIQKLEPSLAAGILEHLPGFLRNEAVRRALISKPISDAALRIIETTLQQDLFGSVSVVASPAANAKVAGILNRMERNHIENLLQNIAQTAPAMADELKARLFAFEDIPTLNARTRTIIFDQVPADRLIMALRGADVALKDAVLPCLSSRTRRMVEAELTTGDGANQRDVARARRDIADLILKLADNGVIELTGEKAELEESL
jgi:flagellar motor switch protein FliG